MQLLSFGVWIKRATPSLPQPPKILHEILVGEGLAGMFYAINMVERIEISTEITQEY